MKTALTLIVVAALVWGCARKEEPAPESAEKGEQTDRPLPPDEDISDAANGSVPDVATEPGDVSAASTDATSVPADVLVATPPSRPSDPTLPAHAVRRIGATKMQVAHRCLGLAWTEGGTSLTAGVGAGVVVYNPVRGEVVRRMQHAGDTETVFALGGTASGIYVAAGHGNGDLRIWKITDGSLVQALDKAHNDLIFDAEYSPDGKLLATAAEDGVKVWDTADFKAVHLLDGHSKGASSVVWHPDGTRLFTGSFDGELFAWDPTSGKKVGDRRDHDSIEEMTITTQGDLLLVGGKGKIMGLDPMTLEDSIEMNLDGSEFSALAVTPGGVELVAADHARHLEVYDLEGELNLLADLENTDDFVQDVAFGPNQELATCGQGKRIVIYDDYRDSEPRFDDVAHTSGIAALALSDDKSTLVSVGGNLVVWDPATGAQRRRQDVKPSPTAVAFLPGSTEFVVGSFAGLTRVDGGTGKSRWHVETAAWRAAVSPDGKRVLVLAAETPPRLVSADNGELQRDFQGAGQVWAVAWAPDGRSFATGNAKGAVKVFDVETGAMTATIANHAYAVSALAFSPDGRLLASSGSDQLVQVFDLESGDVVLKMTGNTDGEFRVPSLLFSADGKVLVTGMENGLIQRWSVPDGAELARHTGHSGWVNGLAWMDERGTLVSGAQDGLLYVWEP